MEVEEWAYKPLGVIGWGRFWVNRSGPPGLNTGDRNDHGGWGKVLVCWSLAALGQKEHPTSINVLSDECFCDRGALQGLK